MNYVCTTDSFRYPPRRLRRRRPHPSLDKKTRSLVTRTDASDPWTISMPIGITFSQWLFGLKNNKNRMHRWSERYDSMLLFHCTIFSCFFFIYIYIYIYIPFVWLPFTCNGFRIRMLLSIVEIGYLLHNSLYLQLLVNRFPIKMLFDVCSCGYR